MNIGPGIYGIVIHFKSYNSQNTCIKLDENFDTNIFNLDLKKYMCKNSINSDVFGNYMIGELDNCHDVRALVLNNKLYKKIRFRNE